MKLDWKKALIAAGAMFALGAALCVTALARVDFDFWRLSTDYDESVAMETAQYDPAELTEIVVDLSVDDLRVEPSEDSLVHIRYAQRERRPYTLEQRGGTLYVTQRQKGWPWFTFDLGWNHRETTAVLSLPETFRGDLRLNSNIGVIRAEGLRLTGRLDCDVDTGSVDLRDVESASASVSVGTGSLRGDGWRIGGDLLVESSIGDLHGTGWQVQGSLTVESNTGAVHLEDCAAEGAVQCSGDTGLLRLTRVTAGSVTLESSIGDVILEALSAPQIVITSDTGAVRGTIDGSEQDYTIDTETDIGDCNLRTRAGLTDRTLRVETDTGDISLRFTRE